MYSVGWPEWLALCLLAIALVAYWTAALRLRTHGKTWNIWRAVSFTLGVGLLVASLSPPVLMLASDGFSSHMIQHLLIGMFAPLPLVLAAPVTLALATLPVGARRPIIKLLHTRPLRVLSHPFTAGTMDMGGMFILYLTPLYVMMMTSAPVHYLIMVHFFLAGYLFTWSIIGVDPAPKRPTLRTRLIVLILAIAAHGILSKMMYAYAWPNGTHYETDQIRTGAQLMYYGGDITELILAVVLFATWYQARGRQYAREIRTQSRTATG